MLYMADKSVCPTSMFVDRVTIEARGGRGGNGCVSFRREKYVPHGGPDGGDGGQGGSVVIVAKNGVNNLAALAHQRFWRAPAGSPGSGATRQGRSGEDLIIEVPPGTLVIDSKGGFTLKDLTQDGDSVVAARGGAAGRGNTHFKSATNRAPRDFTPGGDGEKRELILELKVIADVGLVGKPNAGKSTLLSRLTRARPAIADYPFTTKHPNLGIVTIDGDRQFVMADIPGLIEGAHAGAGLGHELLRHIERRGNLVTPSPHDRSDPVETYRVSRAELSQYNADLAERPEILVVSKAELPGAEELRDKLIAESGRDVLLISAVTGQGLNQLVRQADALLTAAKQTAA